MNDRMYELINQCFIGTTDGKLSQLNTVSNIEKFAQLIVRECMEQLNISNVPTSISAGLNLGRVAIKEHFGVEE